MNTVFPVIWMFQIVDGLRNSSNTFHQFTWWDLHSLIICKFLYAKKPSLTRQMFSKVQPLLSVLKRWVSIHFSSSFHLFINPICFPSDFATRNIHTMPVYNVLKTRDKLQIHNGSLSSSMLFINCCLCQDIVSFSLLIFPWMAPVFSAEGLGITRRSHHWNQQCSDLLVRHAAKQRVVAGKIQMRPSGLIILWGHENYHTELDDPPPLHLQPLLNHWGFVIFPWHLDN